MRVLAACLLLGALVSCAGPAPEAVEEASVFEPGGGCRISHDGGPPIAERGTGGTGAAAKARIADRGIGGTGIVGVVTGFASICVDGLEVRIDGTVPVSLDGGTATIRQLRVGQVVVIEADGNLVGPEPVGQARTIAVRHEVSGPIEAVDVGAGAITVAGQRVLVLPTTWRAGRFALGNWTAVSGLRRADGAIVASRLDRARVGAFAVRGPLSREGAHSGVGGLILHGGTVASVKAGTFVSVVGRYRDGVAEPTRIDEDPLAADPTAHFGRSAHQVVIQAFVRVGHGMVWLSSGQGFHADPAVQGSGNTYRNGIVWLERAADGSFVATQLRYTAYHAQPREAPSRTKGPRDLVLPPEPPAISATGGATDSGSSPDEAPDAASPESGAPTSNTAPSRGNPASDVDVVAEWTPAWPRGAVLTAKAATDSGWRGLSPW